MDAPEQLVGGVDAVIGQPLQGADLSQHLRHGIGHRRRLGSHGGHAVLHEVPRAVEGESQRTELLRVDSRRVQEQQRALESGVGEEIIEDASPATIKGDARGDLVEDLHPRRELGLHGVLGEDALGEGVEGADGGAVELADGGLAAGGRLGRGGGSLGVLVEIATHAIAQLGAGLLGEGDGGDVLELDARGHQSDHPVHQCGGLARSGSGLHEERGGEVVVDPVAGGLVGGRGDGHAAPSSSSSRGSARVA